MKRWTAPLTGAVILLGSLGLVAYERAGLAADGGKAAASEPAAPAGGSETPAAGSGGGADAASPSERSLASPPASAAARSGARRSFDHLPDGSAVPGLPPSAPQRVRLGVALFRYRGAEGSSASTRSREEALALAQAALAKAATDFEGALEGADPGSDGDVGWLGRGVLELAVEHAVFSLDKGQVHAAPLDTPRGFWIVRRVK